MDIVICFVGVIIGIFLSNKIFTHKDNERLEQELRNIAKREKEQRGYDE